MASFSTVFDEFILDFDAEEQALLQARALEIARASALHASLSAGLGLAGLRRQTDAVNTFGAAHERLQPRGGSPGPHHGAQALQGAPAGDPASRDSELDALRRQIALLEQQQKQGLAKGAAKNSTSGPAARRAPKGSVPSSLTGGGPGGLPSAANGAKKTVPGASPGRLANSSAAAPPQGAKRARIVFSTALESSQPADTASVAAPSVSRSATGANAVSAQDRPTSSAVTPASSEQGPYAAAHTEGRHEQLAGTKRAVTESAAGIESLPRARQATRQQRQPQPQPGNLPGARTVSDAQQPQEQLPEPTATVPNALAVAANGVEPRSRLESERPAAARPKPAKPRHPVAQGAASSGTVTQTGTASESPAGELLSARAAAAPRSDGAAAPSTGRLGQQPRLAGTAPVGSGQPPGQPGPARKRARPPAGPAASTSSAAAATAGSVMAGMVSADCRALPGGSAADQPVAAPRCAQVGEERLPTAQRQQPVVLLPPGSSQNARDADGQHHHGGDDNNLDSRVHQALPEAANGVILPEAEQAATAFLMSFATQIGDGGMSAELQPGSSQQQAAPPSGLPGIPVEIGVQGAAQLRQQQQQGEAALHSTHMPVPPQRPLHSRGSAAWGQQLQVSLQAAGGSGELVLADGGARAPAAAVVANSPGASARRAAAELKSAAVHRLRRKPGGVAPTEPPSQQAVATSTAPSADEPGASIGAEPPGQLSSVPVARSPVRGVLELLGSSVPAQHSAADVGIMPAQLTAVTSAALSPPHTGYPLPAGTRREAPAAAAGMADDTTQRSPHIAAELRPDAHDVSGAVGSPVRPPSPHGNGLRAALQHHPNPQLSLQPDPGGQHRGQPRAGGPSLPAVHGSAPDAGVHAPPWVQVQAGGWGGGLGPGLPLTRQAGTVPDPDLLQRQGRRTEGGDPKASVAATSHHNPPAPRVMAAGSTSAATSPATGVPAHGPPQQPLPPQALPPHGVPPHSLPPHHAIPPLGGMGYPPLAAPLGPLSRPGAPPSSLQPGAPPVLLMPHPAHMRPPPPPPPFGTAGMVGVLPPGWPPFPAPPAGVPLPGGQMVSFAEVDTLARKELLLLKWRMLQELATDVESEWREVCMAHNRLRLMSMPPQQQWGAPPAAVGGAGGGEGPAGEDGAPPHQPTAAGPVGEGFAGANPLPQGQHQQAPRQVSVPHDAQPSQPQSHSQPPQPEAPAPAAGSAAAPVHPDRRQAQQRPQLAEHSALAAHSAPATQGTPETTAPAAQHSAQLNVVAATSTWQALPPQQPRQQQLQPQVLAESPAGASSALPQQQPQPILVPEPRWHGSPSRIASDSATVAGTSSLPDGGDQAPPHSSTQAFPATAVPSERQPDVQSTYRDGFMVKPSLQHQPTAAPIQEWSTAGDGPAAASEATVPLPARGPHRGGPPHQQEPAAGLEGVGPPAVTSAAAGTAIPPVVQEQQQQQQQNQHGVPVMQQQGVGSGVLQQHGESELSLQPSHGRQPEASAGAEAAAGTSGSLPCSGGEAAPSGLPGVRAAVAATHEGATSQAAEAGLLLPGPSRLPTTGEVQAGGDGLGPPQENTTSTTHRRPWTPWGDNTSPSPADDARSSPVPSGHPESSPEATKSDGGRSTPDTDNGRAGGDSAAGQGSAAFSGLSFKLRAPGRRVGPVRAQAGQGGQASGAGAVGNVGAAAGVPLAAKPRLMPSRLQPSAVSAVAPGAIVQPRHRSPAVVAASPAAVPAAAPERVLHPQSAPQVRVQGGGQAAGNLPANQQAPQAPPWHVAHSSTSSAGYGVAAAPAPGPGPSPPPPVHYVQGVPATAQPVAWHPGAVPQPTSSTAAFHLPAGYPQQHQQQHQQHYRQLQPEGQYQQSQGAAPLHGSSGNTSMGGQQAAAPPANAAAPQLPARNPSSPQPTPLYRRLNWILSPRTFAAAASGGGGAAPGGGDAAARSALVLEVMRTRYWSPLHMFRSYRSFMN